MDIEVKNLHPLEVKLLRHVSSGEDITAERIIKELDYKVGQCNQAFSWLVAKGCLEETGRSHKTVYELTDLGREHQEKGLPAERIFSFLCEKGPHAMPEISQALGLEKSDTGSAFGLLSSKGVAKMNDERKAEIVQPGLPEDVILQRSLLDRAKETGVIDESSMSGNKTSAAIWQALSINLLLCAGTNIRLLNKCSILTRLFLDFFFLHQNVSAKRKHVHPVLVVSDRLHVDYSPVGLARRFPLVQDPRPDIYRIVQKYGMQMSHLLISQIGYCLAAYVRHGDAHRQREYQRPHHEYLTVLILGCVIHIGMHGMVVHR